MKFSCRCEFILGNDGKPKPFTVEDQENMVANVIEPMANFGLRTLCLAYKDFVKGMTNLQRINLIINALRNSTNQLNFWDEELSYSNVHQDVYDVRLFNLRKCILQAKVKSLTGLIAFHFVPISYGKRWIYLFYLQVSVNE